MSKKITEVSKIIDDNIERVLSTGFARYSKYIIQERALPDVRDGLKPVQRRILYSMYKEKNTSDKHYRKSAKTVGNVIGNYHPHGDQSVYDAMVRLSQDWKIRELLVDMHGNNGSIDNDPPAAMRYTEARLSKIAEELLRDIDQYTVDFAPNFDDTEVEPTVLPSRYPNILVNGSQGIAAGYATDIPPHNLEEVINAVIYRLKHPFSDLDQIMEFIKGPDFPTGGILQGIDGIKDAYRTGKGKIVVRCQYEFDKKRNQIIISHIPFEVNKATLMKKLEDIRLDKVLNGFEEARDESDKAGLRIAIDCKPDANMELIIHYLLKHTELKVNYNFNMVVIHNKHPKQVGLLSIIDAYIEHQKEIVINRSNYQLAKSKKRLHILEGLVIMVSIVDEVIRVIRKSVNKANAKENIMASFKFSEEQAEAIVTLQLYRLTSTDVDILEEEARVLTLLIQELQEILNNEQKLIEVIVKEIKEIKKLYRSDRRTEIQQDIEEIQIDQIDMIKSENAVLTVTKEGYIRLYRSKTDEVTLEKAQLTAKDYIIANMVVNTLDEILLFTNKGNYILLHAHQIEIGKTLGFQHINDFVKIEPNELIIEVIPIKSFTDNLFILLATKNGYIKRTALSDFNVSRNSKTYTAISFKSKDDACVGVMLSDGLERDVCIITNQGYINKYSEEQIPCVSVKAAGVKSINLKEDDSVVSAIYVANNTYKLLLVTQRGNLKVVSTQELPFSVRTNRGTMTLKNLKRNNHQYIGGLYIGKMQDYVVEGEESIEWLKSDYQSPSELISNGKQHPDLDPKLQYTRVANIVTNNTHHFSKKEVTKKDPDDNKSDKYEQIELFKIENLLD